MYNIDNMEIDKKAERKRRRFAARLKSTLGIVFKDEPGPNIILCNVGQATGLEKKSILKMLQNLGGIKLTKFIALKGASYSFVVFSNTEDAELFYNTCNGKAKIDDRGPPIYMNYVDNVPNTELVCPYNNPNGLTIIEDFISEEEERQLIELFDWVEPSSLKNRQVKHYGYEFRYGSNDVDLTSPLEKHIPDQCNLFWERLREHGVDFETPDQLTVNKYSPGQGIPSHVDRHSSFGNTIISVSLGSSVVMDWRHHSGKYVPIVLPAKSILVMQGEARYDWQHGIQSRTWDPIIEMRTEGDPVKIVTHETVPRGTRMSLTFRKTREGPCNCGYKALCDSVPDVEIEDQVASKLEDLHVHQVYEQIAHHFSTTRHKPWPKVVEFVQGVPAGSVLLDLGAGNGKNILPRGDIFQVACERSARLLAACERSARPPAGSGARAALRLDLLAAPLRPRCADAAICVGVVHHFSSPARRKQAISTIARLLRPGGRALITVWAKDQSKSNYICPSKEGSSVVVPTMAGVKLPVHENRTQFQHNDLLVPWKLRTSDGNKLSVQPTETLLRYYHVFEEGELELLCDSSDLMVESSFYEEGNWCVICKKL
ncbi:tRNA (carboxymethyluridine(34)-5-O)-methyltransferase ALKBH8 [Epargyreus clarus]|uniref:tRNA (carboxymethyluridine(34)-5-O)-methyltransferase ALKBH8 n=1 Tax=Epargyreus clarus TaxID=520877 RepID=UPI003C2AC6A1